MARDIDQTIDLSYKLLGCLWGVGLICLCLSFMADSAEPDCPLATCHIEKC
ncbi:hypothetical protein SAMN04488071_1522 [Kordiimonas lacus]|uniref:Uncharacterized protein n=1 Tax=Kordiimonas lacus TaxID=637679 RepID=A0A1G6YAE3_9PROT|nr:hypothetical protein SAMN04488071_1522 [Kordiimonas lacus]